MPPAASGPADPRPAAGHPPDTASREAIHSASCAVAAELGAFLPRLEPVDAACAELRRHRAVWTDPACRPSFDQLLPVVARRTGPAAAVLFALLEEYAAALPDPWPVLDALLSAEDPAFKRRALALLAGAVGAGVVEADGVVVARLADLVTDEAGGLAGDGELRLIRTILTRPDAPERPDGRPAGEVALLVAGRTPSERRLGARLLDLDQSTPSESLCGQVLGEEGWQVLGACLAFTRASHQDLLSARLLVDTPGGLDSFRRVERQCGEATLRRVVDAIGWSRFNLGMDARPLVGVSIAGSFPLVVSPPEAALLERIPGAKRAFERLLIVAVGGQPAGGEAAGAGGDAVARFRAYNVVHADVLTDLLDVAPLTRARLLATLAKMDRLVGDFSALFGGAGGEAGVLAGIYAELKGRIERGLARTGEDPVPIDLCRLVQAFEDPATPGDIRTLHGLKRYLHQRGLKLAFGLIQSGPKTTRSVDLAIVTPSRGVEVARRIEFVDLEHAPEDLPGTALPHPVVLLVEALAAQCVHGPRPMPHVRVFCYGNEVHYFVTFRNHPAFIRVDYSPPLRGGMIDLQYLGVSNSELDWHPSPRLDAIRRFFERFDFIVEIDATRIHARYDKERAVGLEDLVRRAQILLRLVPYLMDVDWVVGSLTLDEDAKGRVADAWAEFFWAWGVLPVQQWLTKDRAGILAATEDAPDGPREVRWSGEEPYRDRFTAAMPADAAAHLDRLLLDLGLASDRPARRAGAFGQLTLEHAVLEPIRAAVARGELDEAPEGPVRRPADRFARVHEAERLAAILDSPPAVVASAARTARVIALFDRSLRFRTTGSINGYEVQRAVLPIGGGTLGLFVLRDSTGVVRVACAADDSTLWRARAGPRAPWRDNTPCDAARLLTLLRRANYLGEGPALDVEDEADVARATSRLFRVAHPVSRVRPFPGERIVSGTRVAPGRVAGVARLGTAGRRPGDCAGAVLVTPRLDPADAPFLHEAAGVVSSGGGILSHLGLVAVESGRPALVVDATWTATADGGTFQCPRIEYTERDTVVAGFSVAQFEDVREVEDQVRDGDLLVLDADQGTLTIIGADPVALTLHEALKLHADACQALAEADDDRVLAERGRRLHACHRLERLMPRIADAALARYAVEDLMTPGRAAGEAERCRDAAMLLGRLLASPVAGPRARDAVSHVGSALSRRLAAARQEAIARIPRAGTAHDVLALRLAVVQLQHTCRTVQSVIEDCGLEPAFVGATDMPDFDAIADGRLWQLRTVLRQRAATGGDPGAARRLGTVLARLDGLLGVAPASDGAGVSRRAAVADFERREAGGAGDHVTRHTIAAGDGGLELTPLVGAKAASLGEAARVLGADAVPAWFAVTDRAFQAVLDARPGGADATREPATVREAIAAIIAEPDTAPGPKAAAIRALWDRVRLPESLAREITEAYRALGPDDTVAAATGGQALAPCFVAIRSSGLEEDTEEATMAGQFETFLFVRGDAAVLEHVTRAWAGLWTGRAIHARLAQGGGGAPRGGIVVQRMVRSRVSGVVQTTNAAEARPCEIVINVGLGLGEGIVSGRVAADHVVVAKPESADAPLRFRYQVADKRGRMVHDARFGQGTVLVDTLAHQRLRPALEYPELRDIVDVAARLESAWASPLDIEFGFEGPRLRVLQVRPVPSGLAVWKDTARRFPLRVRASVEVPS